MRVGPKRKLTKEPATLEQKEGKESREGKENKNTEEKCHSYVLHVTE